jgi:hypothetical protein
MAKRGTRKAGRGFASRIFTPVGVAVNTASVIVKNVFKGAKKVGSHAVRGTNKIINSVRSSIKNRGPGRGRGSTRRRKN